MSDHVAIRLATGCVSVKDTSMTLPDPIYSGPKPYLCPVAPSATPVSYYTCILCDLIILCLIRLIFFPPPSNRIKVKPALLPFTAATKKKKTLTSHCCEPVRHDEDCSIFSWGDTDSDAHDPARKMQQETHRTLPKRL